jgi:hypothetical protein
LLLLAFAPAASADVDAFVINSTGDGSDLGHPTDDNVCDADAAVGVQCTLRAALQEADDGDTKDLDTITTDGNIFGQTINTTSLASNTQIDEPTTVDGCSGVSADPCLGVHDVGGPGILFALNGGSNIIIRNFAMTSALTAVSQVTGSNLTLQGNYFGVRVDGITATAAETNVQPVRVSGDGATIGGSTAGTENVFVNSSQEALRILGADGGSVIGNVFGVKPDGTNSANAENIEVVSNNTGPDPALNNTIGGAAPGPNCPSPCNVIANATGSGIDLHGDGGIEEPAGATTIAGNFVGLRADGAAAPNGDTAIRVDDAASTTIGGAAAGAGNRITGSLFGISAQFGATDLVVQGNSIGLNVAGTAMLSPPSIAGADIQSPAAPDAVQFTGNRVALDAQFSNGLTLGGSGGTVTGNTFGIGTGGENLRSGAAAIRGVNIDNAVISGNVLANASSNPPSGVHFGLTLEGSNNNTVTSNLIGTDGSGADRGNDGPGIRIAEFGLANASTGNVIGGDTAAAENVISNNAGQAIQVLDDSSDGNVFRVNRGANDTIPMVDLPFIDLGGDGPDPLMPTHNVNGGIGPPVITSSGASTASGTSVPNATVRLFSKASPSLEEVEGFLGQTIASAGGTWTIAHGAGLPDGKLVAATQTGASGTSELTAPFATDVPPPVTPTPITPVTPATAAPPPFDLAAALKKCKKKKSKKARKKCIRRAKQRARA